MISSQLTTLRKSIKQAARLVITLFAIIISVSLTYAQKQNNNEPAVSIKTAQFEIYAPSQKELDLGKQEVEYAIQQFQRYFAEQPAKIAIVIFDNPDKLHQYDFSEFTRRGIRFLPWISKEALQDAIKKALVASLGNQIQGKIEEISFNDDVRILSHEVGHILFHEFVDKKLAAKNPANNTKEPSQNSDHYGHPAIPDWFDEAVATLCELPAVKMNRLNLIQQNSNQIIPLSELFTMEHPGLKTINSASKEPQEQKTAKVTISVVTDQNDNSRESIFYSEVLTLTHFLAKTKNPQFIGEIAKGLINGKLTSDILSQATSSDVNKLEQNYLSWVKTIQELP